jgi:hypothetical protein
VTGSLLIKRAPGGRQFLAGYLPPGVGISAAGLPEGYSLLSMPDWLELRRGVPVAHVAAAVVPVEVAERLQAVRLVDSATAEVG